MIQIQRITHFLIKYSFNFLFSKTCTETLRIFAPLFMRYIGFILMYNMSCVYSFIKCFIENEHNIISKMDKQ